MGDPVAGFKAQGNQSAGEVIHTLQQLRVGRTDVLVADYQGVPLRKPLRGFHQGIADGLVEQRFTAGAADKTETCIHLTVNQATGSTTLRKVNFRKSRSCV